MKDDAFDEVAKLAAGGNTNAKTVLQAWADAKWFTDRPALPDEIKVVAFKVLRADGKTDLWMRNYTGKAQNAGQLSSACEAAMIRLNADGQVEHAAKIGKDAPLTYQGKDY